MTLLELMELLNKAYPGLEHSFDPATGGPMERDGLAEYLIGYFERYFPRDMSEHTQFGYAAAALEAAAERLRQMAELLRKEGHARAGNVQGVRSGDHVGPDEGRPVDPAGPAAPAGRDGRGRDGPGPREPLRHVPPGPRVQKRRRG